MSVITEHKLVVLGAEGVGKSTVTVQFAQHIFVESYDPTIEDCYRKRCLIDEEENCLLEILDTVRQEEFVPLREDFVLESEGHMCLYSITDRNSFTAVTKHIDNVISLKGEQSVILLVGNKTDLEEDREVTTYEGTQLAEKYNCLYMEISAKSYDDVEKAFFDLIREIRKRKAGETSTKRIQK